MADTTTFEFEIGRLMWGQFRNLLKRLQAQGSTLTWAEGDGLLARPFWVTAPSSTMGIIIKTVQDFNKE